MKPRIWKKLTVALVIPSLFFAEIDRSRVNAPILPAVLVIGCVAVATCIIIYVNAQHDQPRIHRLVLQKTPTLDGQNWVSIATNDFMLTPDQAWPAFSARMGKYSEFYRIIEIPIPPGGYVNVMRHTVYVD